MGRKGKQVTKLSHGSKKGSATMTKGSKTQTLSAGKRQIAGKGKSTALQNPSSRRSRTQVKKSSKASDKKGGKQKAQGARIAARQKKQIVAIKGARSVKVMAAKTKMREEKKKMMEKKGKTSTKGKKKTAGDKKKEKFEQEVLREIDRLRAQEKEDKKMKSASPLSRVITRGTRQNLLQKKRTVESGDLGKEVKSVKVSVGRTDKTRGDDSANQSGSTDQENQSRSGNGDVTNQVGSGDSLNLSGDSDTTYQVENDNATREDNIAELSLAELITRMKTENNEPRLLEIITQLRRRLSGVGKYYTKNTAQVLKLKILPHLVQFLKDPTKIFLHYEIGWILNNITAGTSAQTRQVCKAGILPYLIQMVQSGKENVPEMALSVFYNIAADCEELRDQVLAAGVLQPLWTLLKKGHNFRTVLESVLLLANLNLKKYQPWNFEEMYPAFGFLQTLLCEWHLDSVLKHVCTVIEALAEVYGKETEIDKLTESHRDSICSKLVELCIRNHELVDSAIAAMASIAFGKREKQIQALIDAGLLDKMKDLLSMKDPIRQHSLLCLSNIASGTTAQVQSIIDAGLVPIVIKILDKEPSKKRKDALYVIRNMLGNGNSEQISHLVSHGTIKAVCHVNVPSDVEILKATVDAIKFVCETGEMGPSYILAVRDAGGVDMLKTIRVSQSDVTLVAQACRILDEYFPE